MKFLHMKYFVPRTRLIERFTWPLHIKQEIVNCLVLLVKHNKSRC